jgi:hypothetical protein
MNSENLDSFHPDDLEDDLPAEYDEETLRNLLKHGERGKYIERYRQETNLTLEWSELSTLGLSLAYDDNEPEYQVSDLKELNPLYKGM